MPQLLYGFWDNVVYDNRVPSTSISQPDLPLEEFAQFNKGNPVEVFLSPRGFLVFSREADLCRALAMHHRRLAERSCGKCTPCRVGSQIIAQELDKLCADGDADWNAMRDLGEQMRDTSLCGLGSTGALPLLAAIEHFSDEMNAKPQRKGGGFYSVATTACIEACPGHVNVPRYIDYLKDGHNDLSCGVVLKNYPFDSCCGRVCVRYCEIACRRRKVDEAVDIRSLKRFAADMSIGSGLLRPTPVENGKTARIAVIGAGPAGLTCAYRLLCMGFPTDIYEAHPYFGGMIRYGIPSYRLPKDVLQREIDLVRDMGGVFMPNQKLGRDFHVNDLFTRGYRALFLAPGCPKGSYLGMPGEDISTPGYENGIDFLERVHDTLAAGETPVMEGDVAVVGGGNVAMDCCRTAARMTNGKDQLIVATKNGMAIRCDENCIRPQGRSAHGVRIMKLRGDDEIVSMARARAGATLLTVTDKGFGKRTEIDSYRIQNRGGYGLTNYKPDEERGKVCGIKVVDETDDIMMISSDGIIIRIRTSDIRIMGRIAKGVRVMRVSEEGKVMSFTRTEHEDDAEITEVEQLSEDELKAQEAEAAAEESAEAALPEDPAEPDDEAEEEDSGADE